MSSEMTATRPGMTVILARWFLFLPGAIGAIGHLQGASLVISRSEIRNSTNTPVNCNFDCQR
jgi:hypothetical protein